jgi:hypothetical protein
MTKRYSQKHQQLFIRILWGVPTFYEREEPSLKARANAVAILGMGFAMCENNMYFII